MEGGPQGLLGLHQTAIEHNKITISTLNIYMLFSKFVIEGTLGSSISDFKEDLKIKKLSLNGVIH